MKGSVIDKSRCLIRQSCTLKLDQIIHDNFGGSGISWTTTAMFSRNICEYFMQAYAVSYNFTVQARCGETIEPPATHAEACR